MIDSHSFRQHLELIGKRPNNMLGKKSITLLQAYLDGYRICAKINSIAQPYTDFPNFEDFDQFIKNKLGMGHTNVSGMAHLLDYFKDEDEKAFDFYFELIDEFTNN
jgi:hypothetical protein